MRITIIGHAASGKTTLARKISQKLNIPHIHLDRFWFESGGLDVQKGDTKKVEYVREYIRKKVEGFVRQENWVSDGFYSKVQPLIIDRADQCIFIDIPMHTRIINHLKRVFQDERHQELSMWDEFLFIFEIIKRTILKDSKYRKFVAQYPEKLMVLKSYEEVDKYLENL